MALQDQTSDQTDFGQVCHRLGGSWTGGTASLDVAVKETAAFKTPRWASNSSSSGSPAAMPVAAKSVCVLLNVFL